MLIFFGCTAHASRVTAVSNANVFFMDCLFRLCSGVILLCMDFIEDLTNKTDYQWLELKTQLRTSDELAGF